MVFRRERDWKWDCWESIGLLKPLPGFLSGALLVYAGYIARVLDGPLVELQRLRNRFMGEHNERFFLGNMRLVVGLGQLQANTKPAD